MWVPLFFQGSGFEDIAFRGLKQWRDVYHEKSALGVQLFAPLVVNAPAKAGEIWTLHKPSIMQQQRGLSSTRLFPPEPMTDTEV